MKLKIPYLSKKEYHILSYCEERVGPSSFIRDVLKISDREFMILIRRLEKYHMILRGDFPVGGENDYNYYTTKKGTNIYAFYFKKGNYPPIKL